MIFEFGAECLIADQYWMRVRLLTSCGTKAIFSLVTIYHRRTYTFDILFGYRLDKYLSKFQSLVANLKSVFSPVMTYVPCKFNWFFKQTLISRLRCCWGSAIKMKYCCPRIAPNVMKYMRADNTGFVKGRKLNADPWMPRRLMKAKSCQQHIRLKRPLEFVRQLITITTVQGL